MILGVTDNLKPKRCKNVFFVCQCSFRKVLISVESLEVYHMQRESIHGEETLVPLCPSLFKWSHSGKVSLTATPTGKECMLFNIVVKEVNNPN